MARNQIQRQSCINKPTHKPIYHEKKDKHVIGQLRATPYSEKIGPQCVHVWETSRFLTYDWNPVVFPVYRF